VCAEWRPDILVCEEVDFGGVVVAESLGLPHASVLVIAAGSLVRPHLAGPAEGEVAPRWLAELPDRPTIYFTLGTVFNTESGDLFPRVLNGLRELPVNLVVTVGPHIDPAEFGHQPVNVHIEQYVTQSLLLPRCDVVVSHGGSGSVMGALAHGLPLVLVPMGADQPENAERRAALGVGRVLDAVRVTSETVRDTVSAVLKDPSYREAAQRIRDEMAALPGSRARRWAAGSPDA
jgi:MGT family glycosyltransferase